MKVFNLSLFIAGIAAAAKDVASSAEHSNLRVKSHSNNAPSFNMVSSLIIGSQAAVIIDLPMAIPQAESLADWVRNTTDKPLVAAFTTHFHPDHYLSGAAFLSQFPEAKYYANSKTIAQIQVEADKQVSRISLANGWHNLMLLLRRHRPIALYMELTTLPNNRLFPYHMILLFLRSPGMRVLRSTSLVP